MLEACPEEEEETGIILAGEGAVSSSRMEDWDMARVQGERPHRSNAFGFRSFPYTPTTPPGVPPPPVVNVLIQQLFMQINEMHSPTQEEPTEKILNFLWETVEAHERKIFELAGWIQAVSPLLAKHEGLEAILVQKKLRR